MMKERKHLPGIELSTNFGKTKWEYERNGEKLNKEKRKNRKEFVEIVRVIISTCLPPKNTEYIF